MLTVNLLRRSQSKSVLKLEPLSTCLPSAILAVTLVVGLSQVILATGLSAQEAPPTPNDQKSVDGLETEMEELREELARLSLTNLNDEANDLVSDVNSTDELQEDIQELQRQLALLAAEVEQLRSGEQEEALTADQARALGVAPSAASIYEREPRPVRQAPRAPSSTFCGTFFTWVIDSMTNSYSIPKSRSNMPMKFILSLPMSITRFATT